VKKQYHLKTRQKAKPGTLLKHQIPIRAHSEWDEKHPGVLGSGLGLAGGRRFERGLYPDPGCYLKP